MLVLECCQIVDIFVDDDVEISWLVMRRDIGGGEGLSHLVWWLCAELRRWW